MGAEALSTIPCDQNLTIGLSPTFTTQPGVSGHRVVIPVKPMLSPVVGVQNLTRLQDREQYVTHQQQISAKDILKS